MATAATHSVSPGLELRVLHVLPVDDSCVFFFFFYSLSCVCRSLSQTWALDSSRGTGIACHWEKSPGFFSAQLSLAEGGHNGDFHRF